MIYCSIDIETTGLDPVKHQILEIGAILYESGVGEIDRFHCYIRHSEIVGQAYALQMNHEILLKIHNYKDYGTQYKFFSPTDARSAFGEWLYHHKKVTMYDKRIVPAGKNFASFDRQFLLNIFPNFGEYVGHRTLDPGNMFVKRDDEYIPGLDGCLQRAEMNDTVVHNALDDAQQVIDLIEYHFDHK